MKYIIEIDIPLTCELSEVLTAITMNTGDPAFVERMVKLPVGENMMLVMDARVMCPAATLQRTE